MAEQKTKIGDDGRPWARLASSRSSKLALVVGVVLWVLLVKSFDNQPETWDALMRGYIHVVPVLIWGLVLIGCLLSQKDFLDAVLVVVLAPLALVGNIVIVSILDVGWPSVRSGLTDSFMNGITVALCLAWGGFGWGCFRVLMLADGEASDDTNLKFFRSAIGVFEMLLVILSIVVLAAIGLGPSTGDGYSVRSRISELILSASSARTALSEGIQTNQTWSPVWMSSITISPTGMVASATVGPTGQITVYGTKVTSNAVVTMTPSITTDNKLVWSCVDSPARYMPASCR